MNNARSIYRDRAGAASPTLRVVGSGPHDPNPTDVEFVLMPSLVAASARVDEEDGASARLVNELRTADELARLALSPDTLANYRRAWRQFNRFCLVHGQPSLPAAPELVAMYLADAAVATDHTGAPVRGDYQEFVRGRLHPGSVALHMAAIDRAHEVAGHARPSRDPDVCAVLQGIRRTFGVRAVNPKRPIELEGLHALLAACSRGERRRLRDRLAILLSAKGWTPTQLALLSTDRHVAMQAGVVAIVDPTGRNPEWQTIVADPDPRLCVVTAVQRAATISPAGGPLLPRQVDDAAVARLGGAAPDALTRQGVTALLRRNIMAAGLPVPARGVPRLTPTQIDTVLSSIDRRSIADVRDRSLLLTGWSAALRQSNLVGLCWSDFREDDQEIEVLLRRDKNDPYGQGRVVYLPRGEFPLTCPVIAWQEWRAAVADVLGADPVQVAGDQPCFVPIDRHLNFIRTESGRLKRLGKDGVNDIVKTLCERAGMVPEDFGSHSLRVGFITEASKRGETPTAIQETTGHKTLEMIARYTRPIDRRAFAPARRMGL